jgi:hypothetical protein
MIEILLCPERRIAPSAEGMHDETENLDRLLKKLRGGE